VSTRAGGAKPLERRYSKNMFLMNKSSLFRFIFNPSEGFVGPKRAP
jgi:hypothetical protein